MRKFDAEFIFPFSHDDRIKEFVYRVKDIVYDCVKSTDNLYAKISYSKSNKNKYIDISFSLETEVYLKKLIDLLKPIYSHIDIKDDETPLSSIYAQRDLSEDFVNTIKDLYELKGDVVKHDYVPGDDENFINETPEHWDCQVPVKKITLKLERISIPELINNLKHE